MSIRARFWHAVAEACGNCIEWILEIGPFGRRIDVATRSERAGFGRPDVKRTLRVQYLLGRHAIEPIIARVEFADMVEAEILIIAGTIGRGRLTARVRCPKFAGFRTTWIGAVPPRPAHAAMKPVIWPLRIHNSPWRKTADMGIRSLWKKALRRLKWKSC